MRCTIKCPSSSCSPSVSVEGLDFHLNRLRSSYAELRSTEKPSSSPGSFALSAPALLAAAVDGTKDIVELLGSECLVQSNAAPSSSLIPREFMISIMWTPPSQAANDGKELINVAGHVCSSSSSLAPPPPPLLQKETFSVLIVDPRNLGEKDEVNRYSRNPKAKTTRWITERKPLETMQVKAGCGEVVLTKLEEGGRVELLEGMTTNLFVVYRDGELNLLEMEVRTMQIIDTPFPFLPFLSRVSFSSSQIQQDHLAPPAPTFSPVTLALFSFRPLKKLESKSALTTT
jgi:hypothetical protein